MTSFSTSDRDMHAEIDARIARYGWTVMSVLPGMDPDTPPFSYSIGFEESYNSPEILIMGLAPDQARGLIASIAEQLSNGEIRLPAERTRIPGIIRDYEVILAPVPADMAGRIALGAIRRLEERQGRFPRLVHLILPDKHARFPEDADCDPTFREIQDISWVLD